MSTTIINAVQTNMKRRKCLSCILILCQNMQINCITDTWVLPDTRNTHNVAVFMFALRFGQKQELLGCVQIVSSIGV